MHMVAFKADSTPADTTPPTVAITAPADNADVNDIVTVTADADDNVGVTGVQFLVDGQATGPEDTAAPYALSWDSRTVPNGAHTLTARARDAAGNTTTSALVNVNVANTNYFQNEVLATGFDLPTTFEFLPDGRMLVAELAGQDQGPAAAVHPAGPEPVPADHQHRLGRRAAGHLRPRARPRLHEQPLLLRLLHARFAEPRPRLALHRQRRAHRHRCRQRVRALRGPAERRRRAPRRRTQLRQRREAAVHDRRALQAQLVAAADQPARQGAPDQPRRHGADRQPVLRRRRAERRQHLGPRAAQPVPRLLRPARPAASSSAMSAATTRPPPRRRSTSAPAARTTAGRTPRAPARHPARARCSPTRTTAETRRSPAGSSTTARQFPAATAAPTSTPTTPRTGSAG